MRPEVSPPLAALLDRGAIVKICGLREPEHAAAAAAAGADLLGFVFAPARRRVGPVIARRCIEAARSVAGERPVFAVGVFVDAEPGEIAAVAAAAGLDLAQLHGSEPPAFAAALQLPAIKALRPPPGASADAVRRQVADFLTAAVPPAAILVDGFDPLAAGGSGASADWGLAASLGASAPVLLAGGLMPETVADAIRVARPLGVDVSSGVEVEGRKEAGRIAGFVAAAREAFENMAIVPRLDEPSPPAPSPANRERGNSGIVARRRGA